MQFRSLSDLEEDLDRLLKIGEEGATACREAPVFDKYSDSDDNPESLSASHMGLNITTTLQGRFVYWKGMEPSELLEYDSHLVVFTQELPFQEGKPLSRITEEEEGSAEIVEYSLTAQTSLDHQVYMASIRGVEEDDELGPEFDAELLTDISGDKCVVDALQDEDEERRRIRWLRNIKRTKCKQNVEYHACHPLQRRNLHNAFTAGDEQEYRTLISTIAEAALVVQQLPPNPQTDRLRYLTQHALA
jgi:hypothetical protein